MEKEAFRLILTSEAEYFIANLPEAAAEKVRYNIHRVMLGERNNELFKKLENTDIWEFRTLYNRTAYIGNSHPRHSKENQKDTE